MLLALRRVASLEKTRLCCFLFSSMPSLSILETDAFPPPSLSPAIYKCPIPVSGPELETLVVQQYRHGRFHNLIYNVISNPSVLLAACRNLVTSSNGGDPSLFSSDSVLRRFPLEEVSRELKEETFNVQSCCVKMIPSRKKGEPLILPNLKLKVVMEAIRMALEVVYEKRFATFSYGGRVGMGRHTAVRYLKSAVQNPSWWFRVAFRRESFDARQVHKLTAIVGDKIADKALIRLVELLFRSEAVSIELGGSGLGRGMPQESNLSSILLNIYFDSLDQEIQAVRLQVKKKNPGLLSEEGTRVFHNPIRLYAVRYLDELLVITSGSKMFTMNIKDRVVKYLEDILELKVDKLRTSIHSAISEKMEFMGMELQAVPPSVLHPPMSEKAIRAHKKYLKRKEAKSLELKNARETRRKKLGLKILSHVFKKLKRGTEFKFEFQIEDDVREIFRNWADEVVEAFFGSKEECQSWHRLLTSGDFLNLKRIRDQLPPKLVDAYDQFQEKVDDYMMPTRASKILGEDLEEEQEEQRYDERTVEDLTKLCMRVNAPMELVRWAVKMAGFTNSMGRPQPIKLLICLEDTNIIKWYTGVGRRWLEFFCCCRNFKMIKTVVSYHLRFSCFLTLAEKHESSKREAIRHFTKDLKVTDTNGVEELYFPTERDIKMMGDKDLSDPKPVDGALCLALIKLASSETSCCCVAHFCYRTDTDLYRIRLLQNRLNVDPLNEEKWVRGIGAIHESLNKKGLPLCSRHASDLYLSRICLQDIDCTSFADV